VQGVSGFFRLGVGLIADGIAIVRHYRTTVNEIQKLYGRNRFSEDFKFTQPLYGMFKKMVVSVYGNSQEEFDNKVENAMNAFE
jgi:hypothetical protein